MALSKGDGYRLNVLAVAIPGEEKVTIPFHEKYYSLFPKEKVLQNLSSIQTLPEKSHSRVCNRFWLFR